MLLVDAVKRTNQGRPASEGLREFTMHVATARTGKVEQEQDMRLPPTVAVLARTLAESSESQRWSPWERIKWRAVLRFLAVVCFVRVYGLGGLERWVTSRLSPHHWIAYVALRRRAQRLYRASRSRQWDRAYRRRSGTK